MNPDQSLKAIGGLVLALVVYSLLKFLLPVLILGLIGLTALHLYGRR